MHTFQPHSSLNRTALRPTIPVESHKAALSRCRPLENRDEDDWQPDQSTSSGAGVGVFCAAIGDANELLAVAGRDAASQTEAVEMERSS